MALREVLADLRIRVRGTEQLRRANTGISTAAAGLRGAGAAMAAAGAALAGSRVVTGVIDFTERMITLGDEVGKTAQQVGLSAAQLQAWRFAADRAGVDGRAMSQSLMRLQRSAFDASNGSALARDGFRALGIDVRDSTGELRSADSLMREMARAMSELENETERVALAQQLMGRSGARLLPLLNGGTESVDAMLARFEELGGGLGEDFVASAEAAQDAITDWDTAMTGIKSSLANSFLPTLTRVLSEITEWAAAAAQLFRRTRILQVALAALATVLGVVAVALAVAFFPITAGIAGFVVLVAIIEDLVVAFEGGTSAIGTLVDAIFGIGATADIVRTVTEAFEDLTRVARQAWETITGQDGGRVRSRAEVEDGVALEHARQGRIIRQGEETFEQSLARTNSLRAEQGLEAIGTPRQRRVASGAEVRALTAAPRVTGGRREGTQVEQAINAPFTITINEATSADETGRALQRRVRDEMRNVFADAAATLPQAAPAGG